MTRENIRHSAFLLAGILLIGSTMRAPITGIAPLFGDIQKTLGLGTTAIGALTTLPLLIFAIGSPICVFLARRYGLERSLFLGAILIAAGIGIRSVGAIPPLFVGMGLIGAGIVIINVLLPGMLKREFPKHVTTLTGIYALVSGLVAALASAVAVPLAELPGSDWRWSLATVLLFPLIATVFWIPQLFKQKELLAEISKQQSGKQIWRSLLAWEVSIFCGFSSLVYYVVITWLPAILVDAGYSPAEAGSLHGVCQLAIAAPGLVLGPAIAGFRDQRLVAFSLALMMGCSLFGLWGWPQLAMLWSIMFGFGAGASFILALSFFSLRSADASQATALSGMAQSIGYTVAAMAPPLAGLLYETAGNWRPPLFLLTICCLLMAGLGLRVGRNEVIG